MELRGFCFVHAVVLQRWSWLSLVALAGIVAAVGVPVSTFAGMRRAENLAQTGLGRLHDAQRSFRARGGRGGYATDLASLTTPCPGGDRAAFLDRTPERYIYEVRAARDSRVVGTDCHGRATASDFYAAARPAGPLAAQLALAVTGRGRVYAFFDGIPPVESDMSFDGLAVPLDALAAFEIP